LEQKADSRSGQTMFGMRDLQGMSKSGRFATAVLRKGKGKTSNT